MTKIEAMRKALSAETLAVLSGQGGDYPGFVIVLPLWLTRAGKEPNEFGRSMLAELRVHGVIGPNDGLTIIGSGLVAKLRAELLNALF